MINLSELIARKLSEGLYFPGDMENGQAPVTLRLPFFRAVGRAPQEVQQIDLMTKWIAESIVHLIQTEGQCDIIPRNEQDSK